MDNLTLIATTTMGLEAVAARELEDLGYQPRIVQTGRVAFVGDGLAVCRANLWLRCADRVLIQVGQFEARDFGELFDRTHALDWQEWIGPAAAFPVLGRSVASQLSSVPACQRIVKKALVEKLRAAHHVEADRRFVGKPNAPREGPSWPRRASARRHREVSAFLREG